MNNASVRICYRPVRIGWCVRNNSLEDVRRAIRLTNSFRGGKFNPIIPVGDGNADDLVRGFRVDALFPVNDGSDVVAFSNKFGHLPWPLPSKRLFDLGFNGQTPAFLDVMHVLDSLSKELPQITRGTPDGPAPIPISVLVRWDETDPLADLLLATFGAYAETEDVGMHYEMAYKLALTATDYRIMDGDEVPGELLSKLPPLELTDNGMFWDRVPANPSVGFYAGACDDFNDIVNYWNFRAAGLNVMFFDPAYSNRLSQLKNAHAKHVLSVLARGDSAERTIPIWSRSQHVAAGLEFSEQLSPVYTEIDGTSILNAEIVPALHYLSQKTVLGSLSAPYGQTNIAFSLPDKPFDALEEWRLQEQHFVISVSVYQNAPNEQETFWAPFIPELNRWLGRKMAHQSIGLRVERHGVGLIRSVGTDSLEIGALRQTELASELFNLASIHARPSLPGRIASRLIAQLGGLQGCRVLKVAGVRRLIKQHNALAQFDWGTAIRAIASCDASVGQTPFSKFEDLFIEERGPDTKLKPEQVFKYLLAKGVFRVGLEFECPNCELSFWIHIDDVRSNTQCTLCGANFNVSTHLKRDGWRYRKSGLFGQDNNQEGSIPVALTLQQLDANLSAPSGGSIILPNFKLNTGTKSPECETDIFVAMQGLGKVEVAVGECKDAGGAINETDALNLAAVADAFPRDKFDAYIIFSKTGSFTPSDIAAVKRANRKGAASRVIMLSNKELESHFIYPNNHQTPQVRLRGGSLRQLAFSTHQLYFSRSHADAAGGPPVISAL